MSTSPDSHQKSFFLQWVVINTKTHNWPRCRDWEKVDFSCLQCTSLSHPLPLNDLRDHWGWGRGERLQYTLDDYKETVWSQPNRSATQMNSQLWKYAKSYTCSSPIKSWYEVPTLSEEPLASFFQHRVGMSCEEWVREPRGAHFITWSPLEVEKRSWGNC